MNVEEIPYLQSKEATEIIEQNLAADPAQVAFTIKPHGALIATQIKYLQRARTKLPSYYEARCILPPLAFEQSSSEITASTKKYSGKICIDLTCGLGTDSFHFSKHFERVIAIEQDETLVAIARYNFQKLGAGNIDVIHDSAENYLNALKKEQGENTHLIDLIYIDPARRGKHNEKLTALEQCSPNVLELMPQLRQLARKIVLKLSPLFDVKEAFRIFGEHITVEAISANQECKEVLVEIGGKSKPQTTGPGILKATIAGGKTLSFNNSIEAPLPLPESFSLENYGYLLIPDVTLYKIRKTMEYAKEEGFVMISPLGYGLSDKKPESFFGHIYAIKQIFPFQPKNLRAVLKQHSITRLNILKKDFPQSTASIVKSLGIKEGGTHYASFTRIANKSYMILLKNE